MVDKEKVKELQIIDQNLYSLAQQKQAFQSQLMEVESAMAELETSSTAYKIIGNLMVKKDKESLKKELQQKKDVLDIRLKNIDKQEEKLKERHSALQKEISSK